MPRKRRFYLPGIPVHVIQRGIDLRNVFLCEEDFLTYRHFLGNSAYRCGCAIHAYVLMPNHIHLLMTPSSKQAVSRTIQYLGSSYVTYFNRRYKRNGTLWEGRHKGTIISADDYFFSCSRYIVLNPVRAGIVKNPGEYCWSSYQSNALGNPDAIISPHEAYMSLASDARSRATAYQSIFEAIEFDATEIQIIRASTQTGTPLGSKQFREHIETLLGCKVGHPVRGRPSASSHLLPNLIRG